MVLIPTEAEHSPQAKPGMSTASQLRVYYPYLGFASKTCAWAQTGCAD